MFIFSDIMAPFALIFGVLGCVFWIWMLADCIKNSRLSDGEKIGWVLVMIFLNFFGAVIYLLVGRK
jgi:cytochrome c oxidase assembly factor CtaG